MAVAGCFYACSCVKDLHRQLLDNQVCHRLQWVVMGGTRVMWLIIVWVLATRSTGSGRKHLHFLLVVRCGMLASCSTHFRLQVWNHEKTKADMAILGLLCTWLHRLAAY